LEQDIRVLNDQIQSVRSESGAALIQIREEGGPEAADPLKSRITSFLQVAEPRLVSIGDQKAFVAEKLKSTLQL
jgi:hypothetical protein